MTDSLILCEKYMSYDMTASARFIHATGKHLPALAALLLGFSLPVSNRLMHIALVLVLICLLRHHNTGHMRQLLRNPLVWLPALMFGLLALSLFFHDHDYGPDMVGKYKKLLYIMPLALFFLLLPTLISMFAAGFLLANTLVLTLSLAGGVFHLFPEYIDPVNPLIFKFQITQNFFMALSVLLWLELARTRQGFWRAISLLMALLASWNVLFMIMGRTGYVALIIGVSTWLLLVLRPRQRWAAGALIIMAVSLLFAVPNRPSAQLKSSLQEVQHCLKQFDASTWDSCHSSMGQRTSFVLLSLGLIAQAPLLGNGAGSFWYDNRTIDFTTHNPHNQYLLETVQSGVIGLLVFLLWMISFACAAWKQTPVFRNMLIAMLISYLSCHLFNSFLLDSAEGHLFVILTAMLCGMSISAKKPDSDIAVVKR
jgi:O-antigen ligase